jgi:hypothetical protein
MRSMITLTTAALVLVLAAPAIAQDGTITATLSPNTPAKASKLHVGLSGTAPELAGALPESVALDVQRGFKLDLRSVAARCAGTALTSGDCPSSSRIGVGQAIVHAGGFLNQDIPATLDFYLADPTQAGDLASVVVVVKAAGLKGVVRTRLLTLTDAGFAYQLRLEGIASAVPTFPGVTFGLKSLSLDVGAARTVKKTVVKKVRVTRKGKRVTVRRTVRRKVTYSLLTNPRFCGTQWSVRLTVRVAGSDRSRELGVPCAAA